MTSSSLDPLCIILVKSGAHGGKLLFKYPFDSPSKVTSGHESELHCHLRGGNPYKLVISEVLTNQITVYRPSDQSENSFAAN